MEKYLAQTIAQHILVHSSLTKCRRALRIRNPETTTP